MGRTSRAKFRVQHYDPPLITTIARDDGYAKAMATIHDMTAFAGSLVIEMGNAANMDC